MLSFSFLFLNPRLVCSWFVVNLIYSYIFVSVSNGEGSVGVQPTRIIN